MHIMDEILLRYKQGKFQKCLELINLLPKRDSLVENFVVENCFFVCKSINSILEEDSDKICEAQQQLYLIFDKVTSMGTITNEIPLQLKLTVTFNIFWWLLFYLDSRLTESEIEEYFDVINKGLSRVLGKTVPSVTYSNISKDVLLSVNDLKSLILLEDYKTSLLVVELAVVVFLLALKLEKSLAKKCVEVLGDFVTDIKKSVKSLDSLDKFMEPESTPLVLFKFGLEKMWTTFSEPNGKVLDYLYLLESVLLHTSKDYIGSLKSLQKNVSSGARTLWCYLGALNAFELEDWSLCLGFANKADLFVPRKILKGRFSVVRGKLCWVERNHMEALKHFENALTVLPKSPSVCYYIGQEYGKMGLYDLMVESFEKLVEVCNEEEYEETLESDFENIVLEWLHPPDQVRRAEALYALAVSYGLNERFDKATEALEKVLGALDANNLDFSEKRVIQLPDPLTILHEASIMNLLSGNLSRAEQIAVDAAERYVPKGSTWNKNEGAGRPRSSVTNKDVHWLEMLIERELLENNLEPRELEEETIYPEDILYFLPENVIALLIISEIQRIQEMEDYKNTLGKILSIFSKYLSSMGKKEVVSQEELRVWTLVKAVAGKTCLRIAALKVKEKDGLNLEKMYKRALGCNKGDKDALFGYYKFLSKAGRNEEARSLWNTYRSEETSVTEESVQSFSVRYFLTTSVSRRELEKIECDLELMDLGVS